MPAQSHGFYSYDPKYIDADGAALKVPAELPQEIEGSIRAMAAKAFRAVGCDGMARVDFFLTPDMRVLINELNTIPGFTDTSMYSKAMAASGVSYPEIIDRLVAHGLARAGRSASPCQRPKKADDTLCASGQSRGRLCPNPQGRTIHQASQTSTQACDPMMNIHVTCP